MTPQDVAKRLGDLIVLAGNVRLAQKAYFKHRDNTNLRIAKDAERRLDACLLEYASERQASLFAAEEDR